MSETVQPSVKSEESLTKVDEPVQDHDKHVMWGKRRHYFVYGMMLGNVDSLVNYTIEIASNLRSGGALILCLVFSTFFVALPVTVMETFVGRYTKKTNGQMYTMVPFFIGFSFFLMVLNFIFIPLETLHLSFYLVDFVSIIGNSSITSHCAHEHTSCYDYKIKGKINNTCILDPAVPMGVVCEGLGIVRYPMQYNFWRYYRDPVGGFYPLWKMMLSQAVVWVFIWLVVFLRLRMAGTLLFITFVMHLISYALVFILSIASSGAHGSGIYEVTSVDIKNLNAYEFLAIMLMAFRRVGLTFPMGQMTFASRLQSKHAHNFFFVLLNFLYGIWILMVAFSVSKVISSNMGTSTWSVTVKDMGLVMVMIPEFLAYMESPFIYVLYVYFCSLFKEILMSAIAVLMFLYNLLDFFPSMIKFEKYMKVVLCFIFGLTSVICMTQHSNMTVVPTLKIANLIYGTNIMLLIETFMVFYLYGINRLSDDIFFMLKQRPNTLVRLSWIASPIILFISIILMVVRTQHIILEKPVIEGNFEYFYTHIKYAFLAICILMVLMSLTYLGCQIGTQNACERVMKPDFFWGPIDRSERMSRKTFTPSTLIRSQPLRLRKYRTVLKEDVSKTVFLEDKWMSMKDVDDLERALKGAEEDDAAAKATIKVEEQKGRIFSDTEYFGNLQKITHVIIKTSGKVSVYEQD